MVLLRSGGRATDGFINGADAAALLDAFKGLVEAPLGWWLDQHELSGNKG